MPPTGQQMRGPTSDRQYAPRLVQAMAGSARTKHPNGVRAGGPRPADNTPQLLDRGAQSMRSQERLGVAAGLHGAAVVTPSGE
jgi:hypothetical protein